MKPALLIVDDNKLTRETLVSAFADQYRIATACNGNEALAMLEAEPFDLMLSDLMMPDLDGLSLLEQISHNERRPAVIFITGHATVESAVRAMKLGAHDYVTKPVNLDRLALLLDKALETRNLREENARLRRSVQEGQGGVRLVGDCPAMRKILEITQQVAATDASVLIEGESGTGKEQIASLIHYRSARAAAPFVRVNCAAFAEGVLESELFGHERGAFTGAVAMRKGRFEMADTGTLFLDEIGDLPLPAQVKLLRFLQERTFERVGGSKTFKVDVRVISATHRNLPELIQTGAFREDLYYRLRVVRIVVPPLRERTGDIDRLIDHFLHHYSEIHNRDVNRMDEEARRVLRDYPWPGNVRELMNCMESLVVMTPGDRVTVEDLPEQFQAGLRDARGEGGGILADMEKDAILDALRKCGGNKSEAAKLLGIGLRTLYRRLEKFAPEALSS